MSKRVVFFVEGKEVPASRFRVYQFLPLFRERGYDVVVCVTKPNKYLWYPSWVKRLKVLFLPWAILSLIWICLQRVFQIVRYGVSADVVFLQRDLLYRVPIPFLEAFLFWLAPAKTRFVFDVDDAIYLDKRGQEQPLQEMKLRFITRNCDLAIAGNLFLESYFKRTTHVVVIPTCIDTQRFSCAVTPAPEGTDVPVVGWTGVKTNLKALETIVPALEMLKREFAFRLVVITDSDAQIPASLKALDAEHLPWREDAEVETLRTLDIGLMPLIDDEWSKGKCGFKLLQYMSVGIPCIASPVGVNSEIVCDGANGFLARNISEWSSALRQLLVDKARRAQMGQSGRLTVEQRYSLERWGDSFVSAVLGNRV